MPFFELASFDNKLVTSANIANKVVLFDFWEVWCGPCLASMPTVDSLFQKYRAKGLEVYGMMSEKDQLDAAKLLVNKRKYTFPMLLANENIKKSLGIIAVPTYVLVNKQGIITYISEGFSEALESEIRKALN
jgi:thiol-disulfide isomerase/thioredoxin